MINIHCANGKRKRTSYLFILLLSVSVACSTDKGTVDLLKHPGRWQGDPFNLTTEGVMELNGEYQ